jgi:hypothetical protein
MKRIGLMFMFVNFVDIKFGTSRGECAASGVHVSTDTHIQGSPDGAHSVTVHDTLEGIDDHEECIGGGGGEKKATLKVIFWFQ